LAFLARLAIGRKASGGFGGGKARCGKAEAKKLEASGKTACKGFFRMHLWKAFGPFKVFVFFGQLGKAFADFFKAAPRTAFP
jgi:hypothetical protein